MRVDTFPGLPEEYELFGVTNPRARHNEAEFRDLKGTELSAVQKDYFARQCKGEQAEGEPDIKFGQSDRGFSARYGLSQGVTCRWVANWVDPSSVNNAGRGGRPAAVDQQGMYDFFAAVKEGKKARGKSKTKQKKTLFTASEVNELLNLQFRKSQKRKGHPIDQEDDSVVLSVNTLQKFKKVCSSYFYDVSICMTPTFYLLLDNR